jgi:malate dehydrogenase
MLVGAMPRKEGMDRADLLAANGKIFTGQAPPSTRSPPTTSRSSSPATRPTPTRSSPVQRPRHPQGALQRADPPRPQPGQVDARQEARRCGRRGQEPGDLGQPRRLDVSRPLQHPVNGKVAADLVDEAWITDTYIPTVATRGGAIIKARGLSSAASAANATIDHMRDWLLGTTEWVSMSVPSDGSYGIISSSRRAMEVRASTLPVHRLPSDGQY